MERSFMVRAAGILAVAGILFAACGGDDDDGDAVTEQPTSTEARVTTGPPAGGGDEAGAIEGAATLMAVNGSGVSGEATLRWSPRTGVLEVSIRLSGVDEGARYVSMITPGCGPGSGHLYTLGDAVGAPDGTATLTAEIADVDSIDVDGGWAVKVARPPAGPQACGDVVT